MPIAIPYSLSQLLCSIFNMSNTDYNSEVEKLVRDNNPHQLRDRLVALDHSTKGTKEGDVEMTT